MNIEPMIVAEIGATHAGLINRAKMLIDLAAGAGANVLKLQKRCPKESVPKEWWGKPHPNQSYAYGKTYLEHRENLELDILEHAELKKYCESKNIIYSTSVWDMTSAKEVVSLDPVMIKIPSAQNHNNKLREYLYSNFSGEIHISLGMTTLDERQELIKKIKSNDINRTVLYHCTSAYPCPFEKLYLNEITWLKDRFPNVGFSNHGYGIAADVAALALGAKWFERHVIDDRSFLHTDAAASLERQGLEKLCRDLKHVSKALKNKPYDIDSLELEQRNKLRG